MKREKKTLFTLHHYIPQIQLKICTSIKDMWGHLTSMGPDEAYNIVEDLMFRWLGPINKPSQ
jgi:hypothetical protein